jgi:hypothetical protein
MSALGRNYRIRAWNTQNQAITVAVLARRFKYGTDGSITDDAESTLLTSVSVAASGGTQVGSNIDNSAGADKWLGANLTVAFTAAVTTSGAGTVALYLQQSTDGGTTWPADGTTTQAPGGIFFGAYTVTAADATNVRRQNFRIR